MKNKLLKLIGFQSEIKFQPNTDLLKFLALSGNNRFAIENMEERYYPADKSSTTAFDAHYVYHPAWAARIIQHYKPEKHIDISSTLYFCSLLSAFMPVEFYDYRPAVLKLSNLQSCRADLTQLHFADNSLESLSCMHTVEHIGLGRYGDPLDPDGDLKAIAELKRVLQPGGNLLFVVPIGRPKLVFHAHRIYSYEMVLSYFKNFDLMDFSLVDDANQFHSQATQALSDLQQYGCGCFWFQKPLV